MPVAAIGLVLDFLWWSPWSIAGAWLGPRKNAAGADRDNGLPTKRQPLRRAAPLRWLQ